MPSPYAPTNRWKMQSRASKGSVCCMVARLSNRVRCFVGDAIRRNRDHDGAWPVLAGIAAVVRRGPEPLAVADVAGLDHRPAAAFGLADVARRGAGAAATGCRR